MSRVNGKKGLFDFVCVRWEGRSRLLEVNVVSEAAMGISDHYLVVARVKVKRGWESEQKGDGGGMGERLEGEEKRGDYRRGIKEK